MSNSSKCFPFLFTTFLTEKFPEDRVQLIFPYVFLVRQPVKHSWSGLVIVAVAREWSTDGVCSRNNSATCGSFEGWVTNPSSPD